LMVAPISASAGTGVPDGMAYGFHRGSEIAGPVLGGIPGAVVGGVTGGVGACSESSIRSTSPPTKNIGQSSRHRTLSIGIIAAATEACMVRLDAPGGLQLCPNSLQPRQFGSKRGTMIARLVSPRPLRGYSIGWRSAVRGSLLRGGALVTRICCCEDRNGIYEEAELC
jgi:hypothetical protein